MKFKSLFIALAAVAAFPLFADTYTIDKDHSEATFQVRHLVSKVSGKFEDFNGSINLDPKNPAASSVEFKIRTASINTGVADRDQHLRTADFFDATKYPEITFKSTSIKASGKKDVYSVTGNLTMRGIPRLHPRPVGQRQGRLLVDDDRQPQGLRHQLEQGPRQRRRPPGRRHRHLHQSRSAESEAGGCAGGERQVTVIISDEC